MSSDKKAPNPGEREDGGDYGYANLGSTPAVDTKGVNDNDTASEASGLAIPAGKKVVTITTTGGDGTGDDAGSPKLRSSFAATMWNPMNDKDKLRFNQKRLIQMFAGLLLGTCAGSAFAFGVFSNKIKVSANMSQADMATITTVGTIAMSFVFPAGILFDYYGPHYVIAVATVLSCGGFALLALIFKDIVKADVYTVSLANGLQNWGMGFCDSGSLLPNLFNFPINRGDVLIIQKTFFGLGATFLSLSFDGFFGATDNYIGYAVYITILTFIAGTFGTFFIRLPPYKRTLRDLKRIAKLSPEEQEEERLFEERAFELYHNPRLTDRRRLNLGVTCLIVTLVFFSSFSVIKTYVEIPSSVITALTVCAILCLLSFLIMLYPRPLPAFFDYEFLPDLHPPESLVDKPAAIAASPRKEGSDSVSLLNNEAGNDSDGDKRYSYGLTGNNSSSSPTKPAGTVGFYGDDEDGASAGGQQGRASAFYATRASVAGNSAPIAVPQAVAPSAIPSIVLPFSKSIVRPMIWAFWMMAFAKSACTVIINNQAQIMSSANDGIVDSKSNSLAVALFGIGSACGRILVGLGETYFQRRNALAREEQLVWEAENGPYDPNAPDKPGQPDMRPVYHRLTSSVVCMLPVCPTTLTICNFLLTFAPVSMFPVIFIVFGCAYGGWISLLSLSIKEIYSNDTAKHYNFVFSSGIVSAILLNRMMFGDWFDEQAKKHPGPDGNSCAGHVCYANSLYVIGSICFVCIFVTFYIVRYWWKVRQTF